MCHTTTYTTSPCAGRGTRHPIVHTCVGVSGRNSTVSNRPKFKDFRNSQTKIGFRKRPHIPSYVLRFRFYHWDCLGAPIPILPNLDLEFVQ